MKAKKILLLTPPLLQPNSPYPATMHLVGYLRRFGCEAYQRDLSVKVLRDVLLEYGGEPTDELLEFLGGNAPAEAKLGASGEVADLARRIRDEVDADFGFSRYAEKDCIAVGDFAKLERKVKRRGVIDAPLERHLKAAMDEVRPGVVGVTCPFPGTLVGAFKIARYLKRHHPKVKVVLGGGYVSTELRQMSDERAYRYFDEFQLDDGGFRLRQLAGNVAADAEPADTDVPPFVSPCYEGIDWSEYFDVIESDGNFVSNLWNAGKWVKLVMAKGCYWHRCAFCDVKLPYIGGFRMPSAKSVVDCMEGFVRSSRSRFHFVDEAMPPKLVRGVCEELIARKLKCEWWGNVRFDAAFTPQLARLMAKAGCIAVTGGLECANDRLLKLMNKGITLASAERVLKAFKAAKIFVHAYLMYDFPTETGAEQSAAEKYVKGLAKRGLVQSCFWHRFALTVHSPIVEHPADFGIEVVWPERRRRRFALNELDYRRLADDGLAGKIEAIDRALKAEFKAHSAPIIELIEAQTHDPFSVLVGTILSARTKDACTAGAVRRLFAERRGERFGPSDLERLSEAEISRLIYPVGFYRDKARHLKELPKVLKERFGGVLPHTVEELCELPGVGRKTANLTVAVGFDLPAICVDVHVHRISNRLGLVKTKTPLETEMALRKLLPQRYWKTWNSHLVSFGQTRCGPVRPKCGGCPISRYCGDCRDVPTMSKSKVKE